MAEIDVIEFKRNVQFKGLKMEDAAKSLNMSKATMYNYLNRSPLNPEFVEIVKEKFGIDLLNPKTETEVVLSTDKNPSFWKKLATSLQELTERQREEIRIKDQLIKDLKNKP